MRTCATLFSGGGIAECGMKAAGFVPIWANEIDPAIAEVYRANHGDHIVVADILSLDPHNFARPDWLHMSPVCTRASRANSSAPKNERGTRESPLDIAIAEKAAEFIEVLRPDYVTLENVWGYRNFEAFKGICGTLERCGYIYEFKHLCAADYGGMDLCPIHASFAARNSAKGIAPDIADALAMMLPEDQARHLAYDAVAHLVRVTQQDTAVNAIWCALESADSQERLTRIGKAESVLMREGMSGLGSMENTDANIASLLRVCLDARYVQEKSSTIKMETLQTMLLKILRCLRTTESTRHSTTPNEENENCPLCRYWSVPQTRKRLILRASRRGLLARLAPTHNKGGTGGLQRWNGWYAAIEDLIPTLPEGKFAEWQLARLPNDIRSILVGGANRSVQFLEFAKDHRRSIPGIYDTEHPCHSITEQGDSRAFILSNAKTEFGDAQAVSELPVHTVTEQSNGRTRAFIVDGKPSNYAGDLQVVDGDGRRVPITASQEKHPFRAFLMPNENTSSADRTTADEPCNTVGATNRVGNRPRAWLSLGRVVSMTPRALARFQSIPDSYILPEKKGLACKVIGNGVPSLLMQRIGESW